MALLKCIHCTASAKLKGLVRGRAIYYCECGRVYRVEDITAIYDEYDDVTMIPDETVDTGPFTKVDKALREAD